MDLATQAKIQIKAVTPITPRPAEEEQEEVRDAQGNVTQQGRAAVRAVIGRNAKEPTDWNKTKKEAEIEDTTGDSNVPAETRRYTSPRRMED